MARSVTLVVGDTTPDLVGALSNADGPQDLRGATVTLHLSQKNGGASVTMPCTIDAPALAGIVRHVWLEGETATPGTYALSFTVVYANGQQQTFPNKATLTVLIRAVP